MRIQLAQINPIVSDLDGNAEKILREIKKARKQGVDIILFPELALSGYPPEDFLLMPHFIDAVEKKLAEIAKETAKITAIIGAPRRTKDSGEKYLANSALIYQNGEEIGFQDKQLLPTYDVFDESRYFSPSRERRTWEINGKKIAITICEDLWHHSDLIHHTQYQKDPVVELKSLEPDLLLNLSASPYRVGKFEERHHVCSAAARTLACPVLLCNQIGGNDSLIFDGYSLHVGAKGELIQYAKGFEEDSFVVDLSCQTEPVDTRPDILSDLFNALVLGVKDYFHKSGFTRACLGLSGGIDSAVVACIAVEALGKENVLVLNMPSRYSTEGSVTDSRLLAKKLDIAIKDVPIEEPFQSFLDLLQPEFEGRPQDATEENMQARIRGMILMAFSNKFGYIVLSTGNKSEMAMGYATLYGDMCGGLGVLADVTKIQVYRLAKWINRNKEVIPEAIITKPPSAELRPSQKDSDSLPDYTVVDNVLNGYVIDHHSAEEIAQQFHYELDLVRELIRKIHKNEYKRRQSPPGLRVSEKSFSIGRRFPIVVRLA